MGEQLVSGPRATPLILSNLLRGQPVVVEGQAGIGKSSAIRDVCARLGANGREVLVASASESARRLPFGALAAVIEVDPRSDPASRIASAIKWLARSPSSVLVIDDAHLLDDESAAFVHAVLTNQTVAVCAALRTGEPVPDAIGRGLKDSNAVHVDIGPLSEAESAALVSQTLGGVVDTRTMTELIDAGAGNPLVLTQIIADLRRTNTISNTDGVLVAVLPLETPSLRDRYAALHDSWNESQRRLASYLAVLGAVPRWFIARLQGEQSLRAALSEGWAFERSAVVGLRHGLLEQSVRSRLTDQQMATIVLDAVSDVDAQGANGAVDPALLLPYVTWMMTLGELDPNVQPRLVEAAERLRLGGQAWLALPVAERALRLRPTEPARIVTHACRAQLGRPVTSESPSEVFGAAMGAARAYGAGVPIDGFIDQIMDDALAVVTDQSQVNQLSTMSLLLSAMGSTQTESSLGELLRVLHETDDLASPFTEAFLFAGDLLIDAGRANEVDPLIESLAGRGSADGAFTQTWFGLHAHAAHRSEGRPNHAKDALTRHLTTKPWATDFMGATLLLTHNARVALAHGRPDAAAAELRSYLDIVGALDPLGDTALARAELGLALAWSGASSEVPPASPSVLPSGRWRLSRIALRHCQTLAVLGKTDESIEACLDLAARTRADGRLQVASDALHLAARLAPRQAVATQLDSIAAKCTSWMCSVAARHAHALTRRDGAELLAISEAFEQADLLALAIEAASDAVVLLRHSSDIATATERVVRLSAQGCRPLVDHGSGATAWVLTDRLASFALTTRERQVASLAGGGSTNAEIGTALGISARTAETHLQRAYRKLGVTDRNELRSLLSVG